MLRPNEQRAKYTIFAIWVVLGLEVISFISSYMQYDFLRKASMGIFLTEEDANANDMRERFVGMVYLICFIISGVLFIRWFRRAYYNLSLLGSRYVSYKDNWALWSWIIPIISLYQPYKMMNELYNGTKYVLKDHKISFNDNFNTKLLPWWWAMWIISSLIGQFLFRYSLHADEIDDFYIITIVQMATSILGIPLSLITIKVIKDYAKEEKLLWEVKVEKEIQQ